MRLLLDTHALFWWFTDDAQLSTAARHLIASLETEVNVSVASAWEVAIKVGQGKWPDAKHLIENFENEVEAENFRLLPISVPHVRAAGLMSASHRDPFDRLLASQAMIDNLTLVTSDAALIGLGAACVW